MKKTKEPKNKIPKDTKKIVEADERYLPGDRIEDKIANKAFQLLINSQIYKQRRMNQMIMYERLYNNDIPPKLRSMFNIPIPVFPGMVDTLLADFNDQIQMKFKPLNPAQYLITPKVQALWEAERDSLAPNARWNKKAREDRFNAVLFGRGILQYSAESDPEYKGTLEVVNYADFHWQPLGGGTLEDHTFAGREGIYRTDEELESDPYCDQEQVKKLKSHAFNDDFFQQIDMSYGTKLARFRSLGFNPEANNFAGERTYNLCNFIIPWKGERWRVLFEPNTQIWVKCRPWKETVPSGLYPWKSWATHEDHKNFASKSYADDFFPISDGIITMFNQEMTNREKLNFNARAYDEEMFTDVAKLDAAQYRADALVPVDTKGGERHIADGIYAFTTPELTGTVNLIQFMTAYTNQQTGVGDPNTSARGLKPTVAIQQNQQKSKKIGLRSDSFKECYAELGQAFLEGLGDNMPASLSVQILAENGFIEEQELKRIEVKRAGNMSLTISSTSEQEASDSLKKDGRIKAIELVAKNPKLSMYEKETIYRDIGQFDETDIRFLMDNTSYASKKQIAHASQAIQDILLNKKPEVYYGAELSYIKYFTDFITDHKGQVKGKEPKFLEFLNIMGPIVDENMQRKAKNAPPQPQVGPDGKPIAPGAPVGGGAPENNGEGDPMQEAVKQGNMMPAM